MLLPRVHTSIQNFSELLGYLAEELIEKPLLEWIVIEDRAQLEEALRKGTGTVRARHKTTAGKALAFNWHIRTQQGGSIVFGLHEQENVDSNESERAVQESEHDSIVQMLDVMILVVEDEHPGMKCSVLVLDETSHGVSIVSAPSLPSKFNSTFQNLGIGPNYGSCGTAAYWNKRIIVEDIQRDTLWTQWRGLAAEAGVQACWAHPLTSHQGEVTGAIAIYNPTPRAPTQAELDLLAKAALMMGLAIERKNLTKPQGREMRAQEQSHLLRAVTDVITSFIDTSDWNAAGVQLVRESMRLTGSEYGFLGELHEP